MRVVTAAIRAVLCVLVFVMLFSRTSLVAAGGEAITDRLAHIVLNFTHVPSVSQEETLRGILDDAATTVQERVVAEALLHMEHIVSLEDRPKLDMLMHDDSAPATVKMLASIPPSIDAHAHRGRQGEAQGPVAARVQQITARPATAAVARPRRYASRTRSPASSVEVSSASSPRMATHDLSRAKEPRRPRNRATCHGHSTGQWRPRKADNETARRNRHDEGTGVR